MNTTADGAVYQPLPKAYKNRYPFRLSVPSFVYPDTWAVNARKLAPYVDEVELLFFESKTPDTLPSRTEIHELGRIAEDFSLGYNIHLPTDIFLAAPGRAAQAEAIDALGRIFDLALELDPTSWTLHIPFESSKRGEAHIKRWQERAREGLEKLPVSGIPSRRLAVENLDYPFGWVRDLVRDLDLSICMDVGHLLLMGEDIGAFYREWADRIAVLHLHGARDGKDHLPPAVLSKADGTAILEILKNFSRTLSLEVFSYEYLAASLEWLERAVLGNPQKKKI